MGLQKLPVVSFTEVMELLRLGEDNRVYRETNIHEHSSRSHTIFRVYIERLVSESETLHSVLNLVDLAGSERLSELEVSTDLQGETAHINKSLFTLSHVISKLAENRKAHVPYRDSKLTRIL
jgi:centromeric protein E